MNTQEATERADCIAHVEIGSVDLILTDCNYQRKEGFTQEVLITNIVKEK